MTALGDIYNKGWYVSRENKAHGGRVEHLDHETDNFYFEGVVGYATKLEAQERALAYKGDTQGMFITGPKYGRHQLKARKPHATKYRNTQLVRLQLHDRLTDQNGSVEMFEETKLMIRAAALSHGMWYFSHVHKVREFVALVKKYNALTDAEMIEMVFDGN